jgi:hypothetical protein
VVKSFYVFKQEIFMLNKEKEEQKEAGEGEKNEGRVELRSDVIVDLKEKVGEKRWWIGGIVIIVLLLGGSGLVYLMPAREVSVEGDGGGVFGVLPGAFDRAGGSSESGLSGMSCEDAGRRPVAAMLASDPITRPVAGFAGADMVWELPVLVSGVTRLMAVYQCGRPEDIGSIRSARHDYLFLAEGVDAVLGHWGGSYHALNRIAAGEFLTINALSNPFSTYFRKNHLPAPHNGFTSYDNLWNAVQKLEYRTETEFKGYAFKDDPELKDRPGGGTLLVGWPGSYRVHYEYDQETNRYVRFWGGVKQLDGGSKEEVTPSAVIIMRATNEFADGPGGYNDVGIEGEGELTVYQDGGVIKGMWRKNELQKTDPVHFMDERGKPIKFTRGQLWVMAVEANISVTWEEEEVVEGSISPSPS